MNTRHWTFLVAFFLGSLFFVDWCGVLFQCGCHSLWSGASSLCNIHIGDGPHCPWCKHPLLGGGVAYSVMVLTQWLTASRFLRFRFAGRLLISLFASLLLTGIVGIIQGFVWKYWLR